MWDVQTRRVQVHNQMMGVGNAVGSLKLHYSKISSLNAKSVRCTCAKHNFFDRGRVTASISIYLF